MGFLDFLVCTLWKTNPVFWQAYIAVRGGRASGVLKSKDDCHQAVRGAAIGGVILTGLPDVGVLTDSCGDCVCDAVFDNDLSPVILFADDNFGGDTQECDEGEYRADRGELDDVGNDKISSIVVAPGWKCFISVNEPENGLGANRWLDAGSYKSLRLDGIFDNDAISYVKVAPA
jgi:hypothetical protein